MAELADEDLALAIALSQHEAVPPPPIDERDAALARSLHDANREVIAVESESEPDEDLDHFPRPAARRIRFM